MGRPAQLRRALTALAPVTSTIIAGGFRARIEEVRDDGAVVVRRRPEDDALEARLSLIAGYAPSPGDELWVESDGERAVATAVLSAARGPALVLADGSRAEVSRGAIEFRDPEGRLLVRYRGGTLEVAPATGDLRLGAPAGAVRIEAATDIAISAHRDARIEGGRSARVTAGSGDGAGTEVRVEASGAQVTGKKVEIRARHAVTVATIADVIATEVRTSAKTISSHARTIETTAERVALRAKTLAQEIADAIDTRAGRIRNIVRGAFSLRTRTVNMKSEQDTSIDGRRVLLG